MLPQQYCLRWKYHHSNLQIMFSQLLERGCFCDVTIACEGQTLRCHRVVLCACSTYFDAILTNCCSEKDPIIIMRDVKFADVKCLIEFMYKGEINVEQTNLASLLKTAEDLRIKGLAEVSWRDEEHGENESAVSPHVVINRGGDTAGQTNRRLQNYNHNNNNNNNHNNNNYNGNIHMNSSHNCNAPSTMITSDQMTNPSLPIPMLAPINATGLKRDSATMPYTQQAKRKRGRPPLDGEFDTYNNITKSGQNDASGALLREDSTHLVAVMMDDHSRDTPPPLPPPPPPLSLTSSLCVSKDEPDEQQQQPPYTEPTENDRLPMGLIPKLERPDTPIDTTSNSSSSGSGSDESAPTSPPDQSSGVVQVHLTDQEQKEWQDVIKMTDYLTKGRRPQFWEEPFTKRVMDAIKNKDLEMKKAAQLLGVSYGTLYGRYRETYGCLKHPYRGPFMVSRISDVWPEHGTADILGMLQRGIITIPRAAELMNTTTTTTTTTTNPTAIRYSEQCDDQDRYEFNSSPLPRRTRSHSTNCAASNNLTSVNNSSRQSGQSGITGSIHHHHRQHQQDEVSLMHMKKNAAAYSLSLSPRVQQPTTGTSNTIITNAPDTATNSYSQNAII